MHMWSYTAQFLLEWEMFQTKVLEKITTNILLTKKSFSQKHNNIFNNVKIAANLHYWIYCSSWLNDFLVSTTTQRDGSYQVFTHFMFIFSPKKSFCLWGNVEKYGRAGQATDDNMAHAHCMLDT
jgi:hypothetical protein